MVTTVIFSSVEEFLDEINIDRDKIDRSIVRCTQRFVSSSSLPQLKNLSVVATYRVGDQIVKLESPCGTTCMIKTEDDPVFKRGIDLIDRLKVGVTTLGLTMRAGIITDST